MKAKRLLAGLLLVLGLGVTAGGISLLFSADIISPNDSHCHALCGWALIVSQLFDPTVGSRVLGGLQALLGGATLALAAVLWRG